MVSKLPAALALVVTLALAHAAPCAAAELKIHGSTTVFANLVGPNKAAIEKASGVTLVVAPNGSGAGLKDLAAGRADIAMLSADLKTEVEAANKANPGSLDATGFVASPVGSVVTKFIVNPKNAVRNLTAAQVKDILVGKIVSWKEVGGADQPILVVVEQRGNGGRGAVVSLFLGGTDITEKARATNSVTQIAQIVAQAPSAIGYGAPGTITDAVFPLPGIEVIQPLLMVTKGPPGADAKKVIDATAKIGGK